MPPKWRPCGWCFPYRLHDLLVRIPPTSDVVAAFFRQHPLTSKSRPWFLPMSNKIGEEVFYAAALVLASPPFFFRHQLSPGRILLDLLSVPGTSSQMILSRFNMYLSLSPDQCNLFTFCGRPPPPLAKQGGLASLSMWQFVYVLLSSTQAYLSPLVPFSSSPFFFFLDPLL